jgi:hypothetical protein
VDQPTSTGNRSKKDDEEILSGNVIRIESGRNNGSKGTNGWNRKV